MAHPTFNTSDPDVFLNGIEALIFDTVERVDLVEEILSLAGFQTPELLNSVAFKEEYSKFTVFLQRTRAEARGACVFLRDFYTKVLPFSIDPSIALDAKRFELERYLNECSRSSDEFLAWSSQRIDEMYGSLQVCTDTASRGIAEMVHEGREEKMYHLPSLPSVESNRDLRRYNSMTSQNGEPAYDPPMSSRSARRSLGLSVKGEFLHLSALAAAPEVVMSAVYRATSYLAFAHRKGSNLLRWLNHDTQSGIASNGMHSGHTHFNSESRSKQEVEFSPIEVQSVNSQAGTSGRHASKARKVTGLSRMGRKRRRISEQRAFELNSLQNSLRGLPMELRQLVSGIMNFVDIYPYIWIFCSEMLHKLPLANCTQYVYEPRTTCNELMCVLPLLERALLAYSTADTKEGIRAILRDV